MQRVTKVDQQDDGGGLVVKAKSKKHARSYLTIFQILMEMLMEKLITWLSEESVSSPVACSSSSNSSVLVPLLSQMVWKYLKLIRCKQMLKMTIVVLWKHVFEEQFIAVAIKATVCVCFIICACVIRSVCACSDLCVRNQICVCVKKSVCLYSDLQVKTNLQMHAKICECVHRSVSVHKSVNV